MTLTHGGPVGWQEPELPESDAMIMMYLARPTEAEEAGQEIEQESPNT
jgi:hypothetical protein